MNGGEPLNDCPKDWNEAKSVEIKLNNFKDIEKGLAKWSFDCGFKLDFDGGIVTVSGRFYPPKTYYGSKWDGGISIMIMGKDITSKQFMCDTLDQLQHDVEQYLNYILAKIEAVLVD